jgi:hypothetical protein
MSQFMDDLFKAQPDVLFMVAGLLLIGIGVVGSIKTYIDPGKYGRIAALGFGTILLGIGFYLYAKQPSQAAQQPSAPAVTSSICTFDAGPRAGTTGQLPETTLAPVGSPCQDANGSKGTIVAPDTPLTRRHRLGEPAQAGGTAQPAPSAPAQSPAAADAEPSRVCNFKTGPNAGATHQLPRARPQPIGSACHDLKGNNGVIVAANTPLTP